MTSPPEKLTGRHGDTLQHIMAHGHNLEWRAVLSLLRQVATVTERSDTVEVSGGGHTIFFARPHQKDLERDDIVVVRRFLESLGYTDGES
jgi:hypothetical protein